MTRFTRRSEWEWNDREQEWEWDRGEAQLNDDMEDARDDELIQKKPAPRHTNTNNTTQGREANLKKIYKEWNNIKYSCAELYWQFERKNDPRGKIMKQWKYRCLLIDNNSIPRYYYGMFNGMSSDAVFTELQKMTESNRCKQLLIELKKELDATGLLVIQ